MNDDYFLPHDFSACTPSCSKDSMSERFLNRLNVAQSKCVYPFRLNSAYRSLEWEKSHGRSGSSAHTLGRAVDIHCLDSVHRFHIVKALLDVGFCRIGIAKSFIHVDDLEFGDGKAVNVIWLY